VRREVKTDPHDDEIGEARARLQLAFMLVQTTYFSAGGATPAAGLWTWVPVRALRKAE
jgi:hypothetical protein